MATTPLTLNIPSSPTPTDGDDPSGSGLKNYGAFGLQKQLAGDDEVDYKFIPGGPGGANYTIVDFRYTWKDGTLGHWDRASGAATYDTSGGGSSPANNPWQEGYEFVWNEPIAGTRSLTITDKNDNSRKYLYVLELKHKDGGDNIICDPEIDNEGG